MVNHKLRAMREKKHWSMERAASEIGISKVTYLQLENGDQKPRGSTLDLMCNAFGASDEDLGYPQGNDMGDTDMSDQPSRRKAIAQIIKTAGIAAVAPQILANPEPWERFAKALKRPSSLDTVTLMHLETLAKDNWRLIPDVTGIVSRDLLKSVIEHFQYVTRLLES